jgi:hypothetical protein
MHSLRQRGSAATMWLIKRLVVDHWSVERATKEAKELGPTNQKLTQWAIDYAQANKRCRATFFTCRKIL